MQTFNVQRSTSGYADVQRLSSDCDFQHAEGLHSEYFKDEPNTVFRISYHRRRSLDHGPRRKVDGPGREISIAGKHGKARSLRHLLVPYATRIFSDPPLRRRFRHLMGLRFRGAGSGEMVAPARSIKGDSEIPGLSIPRGFVLGGHSELAPSLRFS